ncbi:hypothetical protein MK786_06950 [Microbacterium sp. CFH 31415]|uniref:hypothetical protein n=1 Tax=Microbacterium sp. CFH 31415 TaxID=2921732 RepID=UPI001F13A4C9|nr:hypothetical protein [Microbacterium sp. CFH 31415]MCH6230473.1 hypothetical protein [Microbacterium sp. CFH 31415]
MHDTTWTAGVASQLDIVARELGVVSDRLGDAAALARALAASTDWQSSAATAFHARAEEWAGEVSSLVCLAETARLSAARARDAVLFSWDRGL